MKIYKKKPFIKKLKEKIYDFFYNHWDRLRILDRIDDVKYWFKYIFIRPRNIVKIKTLKPEYHDIVEVMLHANFQMLVDFVENELSRRDVFIDIEEERERFQEAEWDEKTIQEHLQCSIDQNEKYKKIFSLYDWWTKERPSRKQLECPPEVEKQLGNWDEQWEDVEDSKNEYGEPQYYKLKPNKNDDYRKYLMELNEQDTGWEKEDQDKLQELISFRTFLWTT
jgi:hypothetical protein